MSEYLCSVVPAPACCRNRRACHSLTQPKCRTINEMLSKAADEQAKIMLARYSSSSSGRFTNPDPLSPIDKQNEDPVEFGALITNPQIWNRYAYVRNNPIYYRDPNGEFAQAVVAAPLYFIPGIGQVAAGVTIGVLVGITIVEGVDLYINYSRNKHIVKLIEGQYAAGLSNLSNHPQMDPNDPKWWKAIEEMKRIIRDIRKLAAKLKNKVKAAEAEEFARHLQRGLDKARMPSGGTTTAPKGPIGDSWLPSMREPKTRVDVHCSDNLC